MGKPIYALPPLPGDIEDEDRFLITYPSVEENKALYLVSASDFKKYLSEIVLEVTAFQSSNIPDLNITTEDFDTILIEPMLHTTIIKKLNTDTPIPPISPEFWGIMRDTSWSLTNTTEYGYWDPYIQSDFILEHIANLTWISGSHTMIASLVPDFTANVLRKFVYSGNAQTVDLKVSTRYEVKLIGGVIYDSLTIDSLVQLAPTHKPRVVELSTWGAAIRIPQTEPGYLTFYIKLSWDPPVNFSVESYADIKINYP